jgi:hypothetical protein
MRSPSVLSTRDEPLTLILTLLGVKAMQMIAPSHAASLSLSQASCCSDCRAAAAYPMLTMLGALCDDDAHLDHVIGSLQDLTPEQCDVREHVLIFRRLMQSLADRFIDNLSATCHAHIEAELAALATKRGPVCSMP